MPESSETGGGGSGGGFGFRSECSDDMQVLTQGNEAAQDWEDSWDEDAGSNHCFVLHKMNM